MPKITDSGMPLSVLAELMLNRGGTEAISPLIKRDKRAPNVRSLYNIPYTKDIENPLLQFDWHCPASVAETVYFASAPTVFYIHGGAWSSADKKFYSRLSKDFAEQGYIVINMNFRLMPEYDLAVHFQDCVNCIKFCLDKLTLFGIDKNNIFLAGDSSGAHMASLIGAQASANKLKLDCTIVGLLLYYGIYDLNNLQSVKLRICNKLHQGFVKTQGENLSNFYKTYSTTSYITDKFPPTFITAGKTDGLSSESELLISLLEKNGTKISPLIFPKTRKDARHAFINLLNNARAEALLKMFEFMKSNLNIK